MLDQITDERTRRNPNFPDLVAEAEARRALARRLVEQREQQGLSQTMVAAALQTSPSVISKLEHGGDVKLSTLQRYCRVVGERLVLAPAVSGAGPRRR